MTVSTLTARLLILLPVVALLIPAAAASDFHIDPVFGSDSSGDGSPAAPWLTIGWAISQGAGAGDDLYLAAGEFGPAGNGESFPLRIPGGLSLHGTRDATGPLTRIKYLDSGPIPEGMLFLPTGTDAPTSSWLVEDIAFDGGARAGAGAIVLEMGWTTRPTIRRNTFVNHGSAIYQRYESMLPVCFTFDATTRIEANEFTDNGTAVLIRLTGTHTCNTARDHSEIVNNFMAANSTAISLEGNCGGCDPGELLFETRIWNNTIAGGTYGIWMNDGTCASSDFMRPEVRNDIFASLATAVHDVCGLLPADRVGNNDYWNNSDDGITGLDSIFADPLLTDEATGDFHLLPGSPCIDVGVDAGAPLDDFDGDLRPLDGSRARPSCR